MYGDNFYGGNGIVGAQVGNYSELLYFTFNTLIPMQALVVEEKIISYPLITFYVPRYEINNIINVNSMEGIERDQSLIFLRGYI